MRVLAVLVGVLTVLVGVLIAGVPSNAVAGEPAGTSGPVLVQEQTPEPGPTLDPQTEADARKTQNKLIVGAAAVLLLGIVIWGRRVRNKRNPNKKKSGK